MKKKICPKCESNLTPGNQTICPSCLSKQNSSKFDNTSYSRIVRGRVYGTNSRKIYEDFCDTLKWDRDKANQFGRQGTPLYAENCDTDRKLAVWFISNPKYFNTDIMDKNHINIIKNDGDEIIEKVAPFIGIPHDTGRITFVKTSSGYEFLGVYKLEQNGTTRIYKRISDIYPII